jgi:ribonuclease HII
MTQLVAGLDEVGAGALAGPLVIVVTAFSGERPDALEGLTDSKRMTKVKREKLFPHILEAAEYVGVGYATPEQIDTHKMARAWQMAAAMAVKGMPRALLLVDGDRAVDSFSGRQDLVIKGDLKYWQISAASVVAKVSRDWEMKYLGTFYPAYCWDSNSGYGSQKHREAILAEGSCPLHRELFLKKIRSAGSP